MRQKQLHVFKLLVASGGISVSAALSYPHVIGSNEIVSKRQTRLLATSASTDQHVSPTPLRTYKTALDEYYKQHGSLPLPNIVHAELPTTSSGQHSTLERKNILVIGDVHGCYQELLLLHQKAVHQNDNQDFLYVLLVGDLGNKGPQSAQVIRHVRANANNNWRAIRGNHDNAILKAALGDPLRSHKPKYQWALQQLSDEDLEWLSQLPYTLRIPATLLGDHNTTTDTVLVHAGLIPHQPLSEQTIPTMITLREVVFHSNTGHYEPYHGGGGRTPAPSTPNSDSTTIGVVPWASVWNGPLRVVFGHDARRGLQQYPWATGLDSGACYGKKLTGLILPPQRLVQVDALEVHCPIGKPDE